MKIIEKIVEDCDTLTKDECMLIFDKNGEYFLIRWHDTVLVEDDVLVILTRDYKFFIQNDAIPIFIIKQFSYTYDYLNDNCKNYKCDRR